MFRSQLTPDRRVIVDPAWGDAALPGIIKPTVEDKVQKIVDNLEKQGFRNFEVMLNGALACGHYIKPKPASHSMNPDCPFSEVIECDLRIVVPAGVDHTNPELVRRFEIASGASPEYTTIHRKERFGQPMEMVSMYDYQSLNGNGVGFEFEICVNRQPYYEIAKVWHDVFTPEEIEFQRKVREVGRELLDLPYSEYSQLKVAQTQECRHRVVANYWMQENKDVLFGTSPQLVERIMADFTPIQIEAPNFIKEYVRTWGMVDEKTAGFERPESQIPRHLIPHTFDLVLHQPAEPLWVSLAETFHTVKLRHTAYGSEYFRSGGALA